MALTAARTAFIADSRDELGVVPLLEDDSTTVLSPSPAGLVLEFQIGDDVESAEHDGARWLDEEDPTDGEAPDGEALAVWSPLLPREADPGRGGGDVSGDEFGLAFEIHAELIELFGTLVTAGWKVAVTHRLSSEPVDRFSVLLQADAPHFDSERGARSAAAWGLNGMPKEFETEWCVNESGVESWSFDPKMTRVTYASGESEFIDPLVLAAVAISLAPAWCLRPGVDANFERHSDGAVMSPSKLLTTSWDHPSPPSTHEVDRRRLAVSKWADDNGFGSTVQPAMPKGL